MSKITNGEIFPPTFQSDVDSFPLRQSINAIQNRHNELVDTVSAASIGTTNAETTAARPYHTTIKDRLDSISDVRINYVKSGGVVTINAGDSQKVDVSAGQARVNGVDVNWASATSATIAYTVSNTRYDVVVINSDNSLSIVTGTASSTPILPALSDTQRALWILSVSTSLVSLSSDAREQGCYYFNEGIPSYKFTITGFAADATGGADVYVGSGQYHEDNITIPSGSSLTLSKNATINRVNSANSVLIIASGVIRGGNISGRQFFIGSSAPTLTITDAVNVYDTRFDTNTFGDILFSSATDCACYGVSANYITITSSSNIKVELLNAPTAITATGSTQYTVDYPRQVLSGTVSAGLSVDISSLENGMYAIYTSNAAPFLVAPAFLSTYVVSATRYSELLQTGTFYSLPTTSSLKIGTTGPSYTYKIERITHAY